jgi:exopolyphosphatase/guanosine-5'-triphosphate,3'-diphosphate pyrophosphatase
MDQFANHLTSTNRRAVVDLGSNSVRLVIYEGEARNPVQIFNEKAVLRLAKGMTKTGRLDDAAMLQAETVLHRYAAICRAMGAAPLEVLATSAVRDAENGAEFAEKMVRRLPEMRINILSGEQEAALSAEGVLCGIPGADGILADLGGGSLELVRLDAGRVGQAVTIPVGVIRLADRAGGDLLRARAIVSTALEENPFIGEAAGRDLYLSGGAFRALARIHIAQTGYPLNMVHHYTIGREEARDLAGVVSEAGRKLIERMPGVPRRRIDDLPYAAIILRRLLRSSGVNRVVFSANGLREGWFARMMPPEVRAEDPLLAAGRDLTRGIMRDAGLPPALIAWTSPLFPGETGAQRRLREAACWLSDIGAALRSPARSPFPRPGPHAAGHARRPPRRNSGRGTPPGLHPLRRHPAIIGRHHPHHRPRPPHPRPRRSQWCFCGGIGVAPPGTAGPDAGPGARDGDTVVF